MILVVCPASTSAFCYLTAVMVMAPTEGPRASTLHTALQYLEYRGTSVVWIHVSTGSCCTVVVIR